jgi:hypothetical protein
MLLQELDCQLIKPEKRKDLDKYVDGAVAASIEFAQMIAGQRAVYRVFVPIVSGLVKKKHDADLTNVDEEFETGDEELGGSVQHVAKPGLKKYGNSMGQHLDRESVVLEKAFVVMKS